ncbi:MAG: hypothetical protein CVU50_01295 [Candidatus Cloacimonetes bacterium HGW-Cloacimonetes-3]|jgi:hypothetical protein|nr:MAG: hypothetical protein CVU50_01295 [Candidatus Cloacimonetes bacterium HGW-Cloacimonetes-3]
MKKLLYVLFILVAVVLSSCSEKDNNTNNNPTDLNIYGYKLDQFISQAAVHDLITSDAEDVTDYRSLFAYEIVSADEDAWSPRQSVNAGYDLSWESFKDGFFIPSDNKKTWFADASLPGAFKVRNTGTFRLYRKVDIVAGGSTKLAELHSLPKHNMTNWASYAEDAIKLSDLLQGITNYTSVKLVAGDGYAVDYTPEQIQDAYYFLNTETTTFPSFNGSMTGSQKKFKRLARLEITTLEVQSHNFTVADHATVNITFPVPTDLSSYTRTVMTDY